MLMMFLIRFNPHPAVKLDERPYAPYALRRHLGFNPHPAVKLDERFRNMESKRNDVAGFNPHPEGGT